MVVFSPTSANNRNKRRVSFNYYIMKKTLFILLAILLAGCSDTVVKTITVTNPSDDFREHEAVLLPLSDLHETIDNFSNLILKDEEGNELPYQLVTYPESALLFFATTKAHFSSRYAAMARCSGIGGKGINMLPNFSFVKCGIVALLQTKST